MIEFVNLHNIRNMIIFNSFLFGLWHMEFLEWEGISKILEYVLYVYVCVYLCLQKPDIIKWNKSI